MSAAAPPVTVPKLAGVQKGPKRTTRFSSDLCSLIPAAKHGLTSDFEGLLRRKDVNIEEVDDEGRTALMWASNGGHTDVMKMILNARADVEVRNDAGATALMVAVSRGQLAAVRMLLEAKAHVNGRNSENKFTPLLYAAYDPNFHAFVVE